MDRRGFLRGMLALGTAPTIVRASSLMPVVVPKHIQEGILLLSPITVQRPILDDDDYDYRADLDRLILEAHNRTMAAAGKELAKLHWLESYVNSPDSSILIPAKILIG